MMSIYYQSQNFLGVVNGKKGKNLDGKSVLWLHLQENSTTTTQNNNAWHTDINF